VSDRSFLIPGQPLKISSAKDRSRLGHALSEQVDDLELRNQPLFKDIRVWWDWHDAKPRMKHKDFPFKNASNIVVPLIQIMSNAMINRLYGMIFSAGRRIWMGHTENHHEEDRVKNVLRWINFQANNNDFNYRASVYNWLAELVPIGSSVLALNYRDDRRMVFAGQSRGKIRSQEVSFARGPNFEHVPREQILWDTHYEIGDAPRVVRELHYSWSELNHAANVNAGWFTDELETLQKHAGLEGPSVTVTQSKNESDSRAMPFDDTDHDIREIHVDWPVLNSLGFEADDLDVPGKEDAGVPSVPLVFVLHRQSRRLLYAGAEPYFFPYKPFFDGYYRKRPGRGHSVGMAKDLASMQSGLTTTLNQAIDARTRSNAIWGITSRQELVNQPIDPRRWIYAPQGTTVEFPTPPTNVLQDTSIMNTIQIMAERLTGQADPAFGRESRSGGHPSPATSTLALMEQADQTIGTVKDGIRQQVARMGEAAATLYQQFETDENDRINRTLGPIDGQLVKDFIFPRDPIAASMTFDVTAMSEGNNPAAEMGKMIQLTQLNVQYWGFIMQGMTVMSQAQAQGQPQIAEMARQGILAQTKFQELVLDHGDIDDIENYTLKIREGLADAQAQVQGAAEQLGSLAGTQRSVPQQGVGGPGSAAGRGGAGALASFGL
jgi:hypothetical protein